MTVHLDPVFHIGLAVVVGWRIDSIGDGYFEYPQCRTRLDGYVDGASEGVSDFHFGVIYMPPAYYLWVAVQLVLPP